MQKRELVYICDVCGHEDKPDAKQKTKRRVSPMPRWWLRVSAINNDEMVIDNKDVCDLCITAVRDVLLERAGR